MIVAHHLAAYLRTPCTFCLPAKVRIAIPYLLYSSFRWSVLLWFEWHPELLDLSVLTDFLFVPLIATALVGLFVGLDLAVTWTNYASLLSLSAS